jgi:signal transduction histidine kinase
MSRSGLGEERLERLIAVGRSVLSELDLDVVLDRVLDTARELTGARFAALGILDEDRRALAQFVARGIDERTRRAIPELPHGRGVLGALIQDPRPLRIADVGDHPLAYGFPRDHPLMRGFLGVPILIRGKPWGNLYLAEKPGSAFDQTDEDAVVVLADWAAIAVENARLYRTIDASRRGFEATAGVVRAVAGQTDLDQILELIVDRGRRLVQSRAMLILLHEGDELVCAAGAGRVDVDDHLRLPVAGSTAGDVLHRGRALRFAELERDLRAEGAALGVHDATAALLVPLTYRGTALGVLVAFDRLAADVRFSGEDEEVLDAFAASAAIAVAAARTVAADRLRRSMQAAEAERRRWARELHDETLQGLGSLQVRLFAAAQLDDRDAMSDAVRDAMDHAGREIDNLRAIIAELRPAALDELGLRAALSALVRRTEATAGLEVVTDFALEEDARLPPEMETTIYRVVQEALTNVVKHARARRVEVAVRELAGTLELRVADDGTGFDPGAADGGYGLVSMRERVELAGGELRIEPGPRGTAVSARLPLVAS